MQRDHCLRRAVLFKQSISLAKPPQGFNISPQTAVVWKMQPCCMPKKKKERTVKEIKQFSFYICIYAEINPKIFGFCKRETYFGGINKLLERRWGGMSGTVLEWGESLKWNGLGEFKRRVTGSKKVLSLSSALLQEAHTEHVSESSDKNTTSCVVSSPP